MLKDQIAPVNLRSFLKIDRDRIDPEKDRRDRIDYVGLSLNLSFREILRNKYSSKPLKCLALFFLE